MKRHVISFPRQCFQHFSYHSHLDLFLNRLPFFKRCFSEKNCSFDSTTRNFPNYSPRKPILQDSKLVHRISIAIKQRRSEPLRRVLKPYESKFQDDHLVWVLMSIRNDYILVLNFFEWACLRRDPSLEARCILAQIAIASKDMKMARKLIQDFWVNPNLDVGVSFGHFVEQFIVSGILRVSGSSEHSPVGCNLQNK